MNKRQPKQISIHDWEARYRELITDGLEEPFYGGPLNRHLQDGDYRLLRIKFDDSAASLNLWNFLLTEEERLHKAKGEGKKIIGTMKDLGTVPVMVYSLPDMIAFYPDGAWWIPCVMELSSSVLDIASKLGIDESFCPVRAMIGAFVSENHFPLPDLSICSVGATCDDFTAIVQRLAGLGYPVFWWEIPHRQEKNTIRFNNTEQIAFVKNEMERIKNILEDLAGTKITDELLSNGISAANKIRACLNELRYLTFTARRCPLPALEMLIAEMLAIHFCSDRDQAYLVLKGLLDEVKRRVAAHEGFFDEKAAKIFWVNPVADIKIMNTLEECGGRVCGTEYLFTHALDLIPTSVPPLDALARMALADPMVGSIQERAERICNDVKIFGSEAVLISKIPGASHCALEGTLIRGIVEERLKIPVIEIEVSPVSDSFSLSLVTRIEALVETVKQRRVADSW